MHIGKDSEDAREPRQIQTPCATGENIDLKRAKEGSDIEIRDTDINSVGGTISESHKTKAIERGNSTNIPTSPAMLSLNKFYEVQLSPSFDRPNKGEDIPGKEVIDGGIFPFRRDKHESKIKISTLDPRQHFIGKEEDQLSSDIVRNQEMRKQSSNSGKIEESFRIDSRKENEKENITRKQGKSIKRIRSLGSIEVLGNRKAKEDEPSSNSPLDLAKKENSYLGSFDVVSSNLNSMPSPKTVNYLFEQILSCRVFSPSALKALREQTPRRKWELLLNELESSGRLGRADGFQKTSHRNCNEIVHLFSNISKGDAYASHLGDGLTLLHTNVKGSAQWYIAKIRLGTISFEEYSTLNGKLSDHAKAYDSFHSFVSQFLCSEGDAALASALSRINRKSIKSNEEFDKEYIILKCVKNVFNEKIGVAENLTYEQYEESSIERKCKVIDVIVYSLISPKLKTRIIVTEILIYFVYTKKTELLKSILESLIGLQDFVGDFFRFQSWFRALESTLDQHLMKTNIGGKIINKSLVEDYSLTSMLLVNSIFENFHFGNRLSLVNELNKSNIERVFDKLNFLNNRRINEEIERYKEVTTPQYNHYILNSNERSDINLSNAFTIVDKVTLLTDSASFDVKASKALSLIDELLLLYILKGYGDHASFIDSAFEGNKKKRNTDSGVSTCALGNGCHSNAALKKSSECKGNRVFSEKNTVKEYSLHKINSGSRESSQIKHEAKKESDPKVASDNPIEKDNVAEKQDISIKKGDCGSSHPTSPSKVENPPIVPTPPPLPEMLSRTIANSAIEQNAASSRIPPPPPLPEMLSRTITNCPTEQNTVSNGMPPPPPLPSSIFRPSLDAKPVKEGDHPPIPPPLPLDLLTKSRNEKEGNFNTGEKETKRENSNAETNETSKESITLQPKIKLKQIHWNKLDNIEKTFWKEVDKKRLAETLFDKGVLCKLEEAFAAKPATRIPNNKSEKSKSHEKSISFLPQDLLQQFGIRMHMFSSILTEELILKILHCDRDIIDCSNVLEFFNNDSILNISESTLMKYVPYSRNFKDTDSKPQKSTEELERADRIYVELCFNMRHYWKSRSRALLFIHNYKKEYFDLSEKLDLLDEANNSIKNCDSLKYIFGVILTVGNFMNDPSKRALGFRLDTLLRLRFMKDGTNAQSFIEYIEKIVRNTFSEYGSFVDELSPLHKVANILIEQVESDCKDYEKTFHSVLTSTTKGNLSDPSKLHPEDRILKIIDRSMEDMKTKNSLLQFHFQKTMKENIALVEFFGEPSSEVGVRNAFFDKIMSFVDEFKKAHFSNVQKEEELRAQEARKHRIQNAEIQKKKNAEKFNQSVQAEEETYLMPEANEVGVSSFNKKENDASAVIDDLLLRLKEKKMSSPSIRLKSREKYFRLGSPEDIGEEVSANDNNHHAQLDLPVTPKEEFFNEDYESVLSLKRRLTRRRQDNYMESGPATSQGIGKDSDVIMRRARIMLDQLRNTSQNHDGALRPIKSLITNMTNE